MNMFTPESYEEFLKLAAEGTVVPVVKRVLADLLTPVAAYLKIERLSPYSFLLESVEGGEKVARYSFLGFDPHIIVRSRADKVTVEASPEEAIDIPGARPGQGGVIETDYPMLPLLRRLAGRH